MWRLMILLSVLYVCTVVCSAQENDQDAILKVLGKSAPEDVDPNEVERLSDFIERPLKLNKASFSKLTSSGLFTPYQVASLMDYRHRHGDIMSLYELSSVDGFNTSIVESLSPFISLQGGNLTERKDRDIETDIAVKGGVKQSGIVLSSSYGLKYKVNVADVFSAGITFGSTGKEGRPDIGTSYLSVNMRKISTRIVAGDFNVRFGQGLALWNGMTMSGLTSVSSFYNKPSGLSASWSFAGDTALSGLAAEIGLGRFTLVPLLAIPGIRSTRKNGTEQPLLAGFNLVWRGRIVSFSCTHYSEYSDIMSRSGIYIKDMKTAADVALCKKGRDVFAEFAYDWTNKTFAAMASSVIPLYDGMRIAVNLRYYPVGFNPSRSAAPRSGSKCSDEAGISLCVDYDKGLSGKHKVNIAADAASFPQRSDMCRRQIKLYADWEICLSPFLLLKLRACERLRNWENRFRTDLRADFRFSMNSFILGGRFNYLRCDGNAFLGYLESGIKKNNLSLYCRTGLFQIDNWNDRIYVYERDAPGSFNVPAFYGRGAWVAFSGSWRFARWGRLYLRGASTVYPFMSQEKKKPGKAELKLQLIFSF